MIKLKKRTFLIYLALYLTALILGGATQMRRPDTVLNKLLNIIWSLMPSQTFNWFAISFIILVILLALMFAAGYILITRLENLRTRPSI